MSRPQQFHPRLATFRGWTLAVAAVPLAIAAASAAPAQAHPAAVGPPPARNAPAQLAIGNLRAATPAWLGVEQATRVNEQAATAEAQLAAFYGQAGMPSARAHAMAANTIGDAAIGAGVGMAAASPLVVTSGLVGGVAGLVAGVPFLPIGLLIGPAVGGAIGAGVILAPAAAVGGGVGALIGAATGAPAAPVR